MKVKGNGLTARILHDTKVIDAFSIGTTMLHIAFRKPFMGMGMECGA
jgi:hypothetical protein